ncbi:MAG: hypothetical protein JWQ96_2943 [Segetibacter sp.]|nr:hypothetical protein [Segetibacter sp.]
MKDSAGPLRKTLETLQNDLPMQCLRRNDDAMKH